MCWVGHREIVQKVQVTMLHQSSEIEHPSPDSIVSELQVIWHGYFPHEKGISVQTLCWAASQPTN